MGALAALRIMSRDVFVNSMINGRAFPRFLRGRAWSALGHTIAKDAAVNPDCFLGSIRGLTIGSGSFINYGCFFDLGAPTSIGERTAVGYQVMFITCTHEIGEAHARSGPVVTRPIRVGDGCWIGARATLLPGVTVGDGCVIAAGSVVVDDCVPHGMYAGVPARLVRMLEPHAARP